jgi:bifunctional UDP-N-acetylglucosamine pyrophosphorylase/glucosamine-1-phosphate N-acetyltransferase
MADTTKNTDFSETGVLILAAGLGTRMKSELPKVLHNAGGRPLVAHVLRAAQALSPSGICVVLGHKAQLVRENISANASGWGITASLETIEQQNLTGSGTAATEASGFIKKFKRVLILCGDAPFIRTATLAAMASSKAEAVVLTAMVPDPHGYGRIVRSGGDNVARIVEQSSTTPEINAIKEINSGIYLFDSAALLKALPLLRPNPPKNEYYLTDAIEYIRAAGGAVKASLAGDYTEMLGINSRKQLAQAEKLLRLRKLEELMDSGVTITDPDTTYIDDSVSIGQDTVIYPGTHIYGNTVIGANCAVGPNAFLKDMRIADNCEILLGSHLAESIIAEYCVIGPYARIRPKCELAQKAKVGNFSELKAAKVGKGSKVPHLSYVGDAELGAAVNVGAGTITCNYDGVHKHRTVLGDGVFVGSNVNLVAPVTVGNNAKLGAGSTITDDVPAGALAIARARQIVKERKS